MPRYRAFLLALLALSFAGGHARAATVAGAELTVEREPAAEDCPDAAELGRRIAALWMAPPAEAVSTIRVDVRFARSAHGRGYEAELRASGAKAGTRDLSTQATTCGSLADAVTVALALLLDMEPLPVPRPELARPSLPAGQDSRARGSERRSWELAGAAAFGTTLGALGDRATGFLVASLLLRSRWFAGEVGAFWVTPRAFPYDPGFVDVGIAGALANGCYRSGPTGRPALSWRPCLGVRVGSLRAEGQGFDVNYSAVHRWIALTASIHAELTLSHRLRFLAGISLWAPLERHELTVGGRGAAFRSWSAAGAAQLGLEYTIW